MDESEKREAFEAMDGLVKVYHDEKDEKNCIMLINGKRFKLRSNVIIFETPTKAITALRNAMYKHFRWRRTSYSNFTKFFDKWVEERVVLVSPEDYYRAKRKIRENAT